MSQPDAVTYVSPFEAARLVDRDRARRYLAADMVLWRTMEKAGFLTTRLRAIGPPRIVQVGPAQANVCVKAAAGPTA